MSIGSFCKRCNSAFCNHALAINAHNMRLEYDRMMAGMRMDISQAITTIGTSHELTVATDGIKDRKLLLLRRGR